MELNQVIERIERVKEFDWKKHKTRFSEIVQKKPLTVGFMALALLLFFNLMGLSKAKENRIIERSSEVSFQNGRILNDRESTFYYGKEKLLSKKAQTMLESQAKLETRLAELEKKLQESGAAAVTAQISNAQASSALTNIVANETQSPSTKSVELGVEIFPPTEALEGGMGNSGKRDFSKRGSSLLKGPDLIAFPVKSIPKTEGVILPSGSYVKAKILTGVEVPEGKTYPVLMMLDFSYVGPNDHKIDLSGCFMIAKAEGDLSTERVQMQTTKMSCVSKQGKMFEREVNGFIADDKDGSFAMQGKVNSKQGRVATMAFLASVVEGVGKAVQAAQTTQSTNALGGNSSVLTGDSEKYVVAGGASNAAGMVLLLPTSRTLHQCKI